MPTSPESKDRNLPDRSPVAPGSAGESDAIDPLTVMAIAVTVYTLSSVIHEGLGHGVMSLLLGGKGIVVSSVACNWTSGITSPWGFRAIMAAGTLMNFLQAAVAFGLLRSVRSLSAAGHYFLWLMMTVGGLQGAGYLAVPTLIGFGDWTNFLRGLEPQLLIRGGLILLGVVLYMALVVLSVNRFEIFQSRDASRRNRRAFLLMMLPYFTGGIAIVLSAARNPQGAQLIVISAGAATFGGVSALFWMPFWSGGKKPSADTPEPPVRLLRSWGWIAAGTVALLVLMTTLGPGVTLNG